MSKERQLSSIHPADTSPESVVAVDETVAVSAALNETNEHVNLKEPEITQASCEAEQSRLAIIKARSRSRESARTLGVKRWK